MSHIIKNWIFAHAKTKAQMSCAITAQLISTFFLLNGKYISSSSKIQNIKLLGILSDYTDWFVSDLVGNPKDRFSCIAAHI